jgi:hypothetical protein
VPRASSREKFAQTLGSQGDLIQARSQAESLVMLAYNLNCWLLLFQREEGVAVDNLGHTRLATARLRFLFVAAKIWKHSGRMGISYSDQYAERGLFQRLMKRLRQIATGPAGFLPVLATPLSG